MFFKKLFILFIIYINLFAICNNKLFSLHINQPIALEDILSSLAGECDYSIIFEDKEAKAKVKESINFINVENATIKELLDNIFDSTKLFYTIKKNKIIVSSYITKTYNLNFIPNINSGSINLSDINNKLNFDYDFDFWSNFKSHLVQLLKNIDSKNFKEPIIDKNSALVTITATKSQIKVVDKYIKKLKHELHKEVLIDVKIYSVTLSKSHKTGIDWSNLSISLEKASVPLQASYIGGSQSIFNSATFNVGAFLNFLAQNGNVNSISNPKIATLNNQRAIINIGYTTYHKLQTSTNEGNNSKNTRYEMISKFVGISLDITPQISDNKEIILSINPRISEYYNQEDIENRTKYSETPPPTKDKNLMSVVKLKDNQTLVLGGLIMDEKVLQTNGVPILKEIPLIKYLFSSKEKISTKKELVFVITPHIIDFNAKYNKTLRDLGYNNLPNLEEIH